MDNLNENISAPGNADAVPGARRPPHSTRPPRHPARATRPDIAYQALSVLLLILLTAVLTAGQAWAMTTDRASARPNDSSQKIIIGGRPTRITWVGTVDEGEEITAINLVFPDGCSITGSSSVKVQEMLMEDPMHPNRYEPIYSEELTKSHLLLVFETPIRSGNQLYIEVFNFCLPDVAGNYRIGGSYTDGRGVEHPLTEQPNPIPVATITRTQKLVDAVSQWDWVEKWNSVMFLRVFFNPAWFVASVPVLFRGWLISLFLVAIGFPLACPIGLGFSFMRMSRFRILRAIASVWVNVIRGTPLFLQIYIAYFGMPLLGIKVGSYPLAVLVLAMNSSAYLAEIFRAGIQSINKGQFEAASSLGMNGFQTMFYVIIPQTIRRVIPTMTSEFILLYKDTSMLSAVGVMEQMMFAKSLANTTANLTPYVVSACFYLIVTLPLTRLISVFEKKLSASEGRSDATGSSATKKRLTGKNAISELGSADNESSRGITPEQLSSM